MTISNTIESYRKRRKQLLPFILGAAAILLVVVGIIIVVGSMGDGGFSLFATTTPTPTITSSPTNTPTPSETPTITPSPTITTTPPATAIYPYVVKEGEYLGAIIEQQGLADTPNALIIIFMLNPTIDPIAGNIYAGQTILLPPPNYPLPTATPIPTGQARGYKITYRIMPGDSLGKIAAEFNSTIADILLANKTVLTEGEQTTLYPGTLIIVPINLVTPVPTSIPSPSPTP